MFYAILGIIVVVALFLIFRDDHDKSYNKNEKGPTPLQSQPLVTKPEPKVEQPVVEEAYVEEPAEEDWEEEEETDLSFLDTLDYYEDLEANTETFDITGLRYHCSVYDCGKIVGYVKPEPSNVHDARAQAVIRADGKLLGYIPRTQLGWYEDFNEQNVVCPFVGEIELDRSSARLIAEIKVIIPVSQEFVQEEIEDGL